MIIHWQTKFARKAFINSFQSCIILVETVLYDFHFKLISIALDYILLHRLDSGGIEWLQAQETHIATHIIIEHVGMFG